MVMVMVVGSLCYFFMAVYVDNRRISSEKELRVEEGVCEERRIRCFQVDRKGEDGRSGSVLMRDSGGCSKFYSEARGYGRKRGSRGSQYDNSWWEIYTGGCFVYIELDSAKS